MSYCISILIWKKGDIATDYNLQYLSEDRQ